MLLTGRRPASLFAALMLATLAFIGVLSPGAAARAQGLFNQPKYAAIVVDANTGEVLYTRRADASRYPASITKVMTLYLTFEALATGRLSLNDRVPFSAHAAAQAPSKLGVPVGDSISVDEAIRAAAVLSANDAAVALAEKIGGNEAHFAQLMTLRAQELGMSNTRFLNANGLPDARHVNVNVSTARDIAILSRAVMRDYPQYYGYFNTRSIVWRGRTILNHNRLLLRLHGMDGLKTGYTSAAGFNLAASAVRDGRRLIAVVLGGSSTAARDENVEDLIDAGFDVLNRRSRGEKITLAADLHAPTDDASGLVTRPPTEMGSAEQQELRVVARDAKPFRLAAVAAPPTATRAIRLESASGAAAPDCVRHRGRHHRMVCRSARPAALALRGCAPHGRHHRRARACEAEQPAVAAAAPCAVRHGRHHHACAAQAVAATAKPDCAGLHGHRARACKAEARQVAKAEKSERRHGHHLPRIDKHALRTAKASRHERHGRETRAVREAKAACHSRRCRASAES